MRKCFWIHELYILDSSTSVPWAALDREQSLFSSKCCGEESKKSKRASVTIGAISGDASVTVAFRSMWHGNLIWQSLESDVFLLCNISSFYAC